MNNDYREINSAIFYEEQRFRQKWLWAMIIGLNIFQICIWGYGIIQQFVFDKPFGNKPMSDLGLIITSSLVILFTLLILVLFYYTRLITEVRYDGLYIKFFPFHWSYRRIPLESVIQYEIRKYKPIREYGGYGIRYSMKYGKAYNVSRNQGLQLEFDTGKRLLIGTQKPDELYQAIKKILR